VQRLTAGMLSTDPRGYVLNDLGTGKTRAVLFAYDYLKSTNQALKLLVICPISAMYRTWGRELMQEFPWLKFKILYGSKKKRIEALEQDADVYIINHHGLETIYGELVGRKDINSVCADELGVYRNGKSDLTIYLKQYTQYKKWVWGLTGSPCPRTVTDVWGPCNAITPHTVPRYFGTFRSQLMVKKPNGQIWGWEPRPGAEERAVSCMQPSVRFRLDEVTELPPRVTNYYEAALSTQQRTVYDGMRKTAVALIGEAKIDALNAGAVLSKLLQIALGYVYTRDGKIVTLDNTPRRQLILDLIDNSYKKVILFAPFKSAIQALSQMMDQNDIDHGIVTGDVLVGKRNAIFSAFQDTPKLKVLLAHPGCMSHSLTLTAATSVIWAGPITSLDTFYQANGRIYRVGQKHKTLIAMVGGTPIEKKIYHLLGNNESVQDKFLSLIEQLTSDNLNNYQEGE
jgi:SNF2 family DNA or RNA helicase